MMKVILTALAIYAIWFFFKNQKRIKAAYDEVQEKKRARTQEHTGKTKVPVAQDMVQCPKCGAYVAADQPHTCDAPSQP